jgi:hypothetical protein
MKRCDEQELIEEIDADKATYVAPCESMVIDAAHQQNSNSKPSVPDVARQFHDDVGHRRKKAVRFAAMLGAFALWTVFTFPTSVTGWLAWAITLTFMVLAASIIACGLPTRRRTRHLQRLADEASAAEVGTLLEMCSEIQSARMQRTLKDALIRTLPKLQEADAIRLYRRNRAQLHEALEEDRFGPYPKNERTM